MSVVDEHNIVKAYQSSRTAKNLQSRETDENDERKVTEILLDNELCSEYDLSISQTITPDNGKNSSSKDECLCSDDPEFDDLLSDTDEDAI